MTDPQPDISETTAPRHAHTERPPWLTAALVGAALTVGIGVGWAARGNQKTIASPPPPARTVSVTASPAPPVTVSATPLPPLTVTASVAPVAPVTVTATASLPSILTSTVATPECLRALELADQGFGFAQKGVSASQDLVSTVTDAVSAASRGNFRALSNAAPEIEGATAELTSVSDSINGLTAPYNSARSGCINR